MRGMSVSPRIGALAVGVFAASCFHESQPNLECTSQDCPGDTTGTTDASTTATTTTGGSTGGSSSDSRGSSSTTHEPADSSSSSGGEPACGNQQVEPSEDCDDGNDDPFDGCHQCASSPTLAWQFVHDYAQADDRAESIFRDGPGVLIGGMGEAVDGDDAIWLRLVDGEITPPSFYEVAALAGANRVLDVTRSNDTCVIGGVVTPQVGTLQVAANFIDCDMGGVQAPLAFTAPEAAGTEDALTALAVAGNGDLIVGGQRLHDGVVVGWVQRHDPSGESVLQTWWLDEPGLFGESSRVQALALTDDGGIRAAGTLVMDPQQHGFVATLTDVGVEALSVLGAPDESTEGTDVVISDQVLVLAGWRIDGGGGRDAIVQSWPIAGGDPITWVLAGPEDDRAHGVALTSTGVAVTGSTTTMQGAQDLFVVWLDDQLEEIGRAVLDGPAHGADEGRDLIAIDDDVIVAGAITGNRGRDMLVQRWSPP